MPKLTHSRIIAALIFIIAFIILCCVANAQSTTVSATVVDSAGTVWANGTWKLDLIPNPNYSLNNVNWNGNPLPTSQWHYAGSLDNSGVFSQSVPSNNFITPVGSTYTVSVCPNATSACSVITGLNIQGTTLNLSSTITTATPAPDVLPAPVPRAYNDAEIHLTPSQTGYFYQNVVSNSPRYWGQDQVWHPFLSGVVALTSGNFNPLFTTSLGADPSNPALSFTAESAAANKVYGNCTTGTAIPNFCSLTAAMIPALPYVPTGTSFFYQTIDANTAAQTQRSALNFSTDFTITDTPAPSRTNVALATVGVTANTYTCPSSVTVNSRGQTTAITTGSCPVTPPKTAVAAVNFTTCAMVSAGSTDQNCVATQSWGSTISGTYSVSCIIGVPFSGPSGTPDTSGLTQTTWGLSGASPLGTTSFNYYIANQHSAAAGNSVTMSCVAIQ